MILQPTIAVATNRPPTDEFLGTRLDRVIRARRQLERDLEPSGRVVDATVQALASILLNETLVAPSPRPSQDT